MFPKEVAFCCSEENAAYPEVFAEEMEIVRNAVVGRRQEFIGGRRCAHKALARLGLDVVPILSGANREPLWPSGVVGSITHCHGFYAAAVAASSQIAAIGIDAEVCGQLPYDVLSLVSSEQERRSIAMLPDYTHWDRLIFSAKESVYKAWFPVMKRWLGFEDVEISFEPDQGTFYAKLFAGPMVLGRRSLLTLEGCFLIEDGRMLTAVVVPAESL